VDRRQILAVYKSSAICFDKNIICDFCFFLIVLARFNSLVNKIASILLLLCVCVSDLATGILWISAEELRKLTSNYRLGLGTFVDKTTMPYVGLEE